MAVVGIIVGLLGSIIFSIRCGKLLASTRSELKGSAQLFSKSAQVLALLFPFLTGTCVTYVLPEHLAPLGLLTFLALALTANKLSVHIYDTHVIKDPPGNPYPPRSALR